MAGRVIRSRPRPCYTCLTETPEDAPPSLSVNPRTAGEFDAFYAGPAPWDIGRPQAAFRRLADSGLLTGRVLDAGCGTGEHALMCAGLGLEATGIDAAPAAIRLAKRKARERGLDVRFIVGDALDLGALGEQYDTVIDSGLFHSFEDDDRSRFVGSLRAAAAAGGRYYLLCFTDQQPGDWVPGESARTRTGPASPMAGESTRSRLPPSRSYRAPAARRPGRRRRPRRCARLAGDDHPDVMSVAPGRPAP